jgi:DNA-binding winged helix-turn-helix (wHTH) protein/Tfp pilus assembly protein PilF
MKDQNIKETILKFEDFQLNVETGELFDKDKEIIKLQQQPTKVLIFLATHSNELVRREDLQNLLWQNETFVDYEQGINYCIKQVRNALGDNAKTPKFVETLPRRGYRFIAPVKEINETIEESVEIPAQSFRENQNEIESPPKSNPIFRKFAFLSGAFLLLFIGAFLVFNFGFSSSGRSNVGIASKNPEAQDAFMKGKFWFDKGKSASIEKSIGYFDQAIRQDENFAAAYLARADARYQLGLYGVEKTSVAFPKAQADAERAFQVNPTLADAQTILGSIAFRYQWNWREAENHFRKAIDLNPKSANAHHDYAWLLVAQKRFDEAISQIKFAQKLDATSPRTNTDVGWIYMRARRYDEAIRQIKRTLELQPNFAAAKQCLECAYFNKAMYKESVKNGLELMENSGASKEDLREIQAADPKEGVKLIEKLRLKKLLEASRTNNFPPYIFAVQYAAVGDQEKAFEWLGKAFRERDANLVTLQVDQVWDKFRDEPFYRETLEKIGLAP